MQPKDLHQALFTQLCPTLQLRQLFQLGKATSFGKEADLWAHTVTFHELRNGSYLVKLFEHNHTKANMRMIIDTKISKISKKLHKTFYNSHLVHFAIDLEANSDLRTIVENPKLSSDEIVFYMTEMFEALNKVILKLLNIFILVF
jgi:hypothetical protein